MIQASFRLVASEDKREEVLNVLSCLKGPAEAQSACRMCCIFQDVGDDHVLTYLVQWDTQDELEAHLRSDRFRRLLPYIDLSEEPPEVSVGRLEHVGGIDFLVSVLSAKTP